MLYVGTNRHDNEKAGEHFANVNMCPSEKALLAI